MPFKGDDLANLIVDANIAHLSNAIARITPKGSTHFGPETACIDGTFKLEEYETHGSLPVFLFKTGCVRSPLSQVVRPPKADDSITVDARWPVDGEPISSIEYLIKESEVHSAGMTRLMLQKALA